MKQKRSVFVIATIMTLVTGTFYAQSTMAEDNDDKDAWQFEITPYLFAAGMNGTLGARGVESDLDMSFNDIWDRLDKAFMMLLTAKKGDWIFAFDGMYIDLADEKASTWQGLLGNSNSAQLNIDATQQIYTPSLGYRVLDNTTKLDVLGSVRYTSVDTSLKLALTTGADLLPDGSRSASRKESWWDVAIGARVLAPFANNWAFVGYADIGAGGTDLTYQLLAGLNWQFSKMFSAKLGYRYFYQDYSKDDFKWDMTTSGVYAGLGIRF